MSLYITRTAAIAREWAFVAADAAAEAAEAAAAAEAARDAERAAEMASFLGLSEAEKAAYIDRSYGLYDTLYDY